MTPEQRLKISRTMRGQKKSPSQVAGMLAGRRRRKEAQKLLAIRLKAFLMILDARIHDENALIRPLADEIFNLLIAAHL